MKRVEDIIYNRVMEEKFKSVWFFGPPCAGKTYISKTVASMIENSVCVNIGVQMRDKYGEDFFIESRNPDAPESVEDEITDLVMRSRQTAESIDGVLIVDSLKNHEQVNRWLRGDGTELVVILNASDLARSRRLKDRDERSQLLAHLAFEKWVGRVAPFVSTCLTKQVETMTLFND